LVLKDGKARILRQRDQKEFMLTKGVVLWLVFITLVCFLVSQPSRLFSQEKASPGEALSEARKSWQRYENFSKRLQGSLSYKMIDLSKGTSAAVQDFGFKQRPGCALIDMREEIDAGKPSNQQTVRSSNSHYSFRLSRQGEVGLWAVTNIQFAEERLDSTPFDYIDRWVNCPVTFSMLFDDLRRLSDDPGFSVTDVVRIPQGQKSLVRMVFAFDSGKNPKNSTRVPSAKGWILLDPERFWVLQEFEATLQWPRLVRKEGILTVDRKGLLTYQTNRSGFPLLKEAKVTSKRRGDNSQFEYQYKFELLEKEVPEKDFMLTAFGFPEPGKKPYSIPWFAVALGTGIVCLGSALWLQRRRRSDAAAAT
jgi:hypothetical protein